MLDRRLVIASTLFACGLLLLVACGTGDTTPTGASTEQLTPTAGPERTPTPTQEPGTATLTTTPSPTALLPTSEPAPTASPQAETPVVGPSGHFDTVQVAPDGTKHLIPLDEVRAGGPPKDGIPSIDEPRFVAAGDWDGFLASYDGEGLVIGVEVNGVRRAYPFQVLVWHEIVNDSIDGVPLLITYCPLCGTGIVFVPVVDGVAVEFGVSGKLYNSDLLMYDRRTDTYWSQITGAAVVGELTGERLEYYPSEIMTWDEWRAAYPDAEVLHRDTGFFSSFEVDMYEADPYPNYYESPSLWFPVAGRDERLHNKTRVTGVELDAMTFGAYPDEVVAEHGPVNDVLGDRPLLAVADPVAGNNVLVFVREIDGQTLTFSEDGDGLVDDQTGSRWTYNGAAVSGPHEGARLRPVVTIKGFWFAWYAFHQDTQLWLPE